MRSLGHQGGQVVIDHIVLDCESKKLADEVPGKWDSVHLMGMSCTVVYEFRSDRFRIYGDTDLEALKQRLLKADRITSFNGEKFDFPLIFELDGRRMPKELVGKSDDLLRRICVARNANPDFAHRGWSLNSTATGTIGKGKIDCGTHAPQLYREGKWGQLINYCADDVALTRDLCIFVDKYGYAMNEKYDRVNLTPWRGLAN